MHHAGIRWFLQIGQKYSSQTFTAFALHKLFSSNFSSSKKFWKHANFYDFYLMSTSAMRVQLVWGKALLPHKKPHKAYTSYSLLNLFFYYYYYFILLLLYRVLLHCMLLSPHLQQKALIWYLTRQTVNNSCAHVKPGNAIKWWNLLFS